MIDKELLFKYFHGDTSPGEELAINEWLKESPENAATLRKAYDIFETLTVSQAGETRTPGKSRMYRSMLWFMANAAAIAAIFFTVKALDRSRSNRELSQTYASVSAPLGQRVDFTLPDGSLVKLNSGATLTYPMRFDDRHRDVSLSGEAYFNVRHDEKQPFRLNTFASTIEVLGTQFDVDADEERGAFTLMLVGGSVRVSDGSDELVLRPGETVVLNGGQLQMADKFSPEDLSWTRDLLSIGNIGFEELMRKMERAFGVKIVIDRKVMPQLDVTSGEIRLSDGLDYALGTLRALCDFSYERDYKANIVTIR